MVFILISWWNPLFWCAFSDRATRDIKGWGGLRNEMSHQPGADIDMTKKRLVTGAPLALLAMWSLRHSAFVDRRSAFKKT